MMENDKMKWDVSSTIELLRAMIRFEESNRGPDRPTVSQWTRRVNRWKTIASMMSNPSKINIDKLAKSCVVRFTSVCCVYRAGKDGKRRRLLEPEVQKCLEEYFQLFPPGRFKHTGRFDDTSASPTRKRGRRQARKSMDADESLNTSKEMVESVKNSDKSGSLEERLLKNGCNGSTAHLRGDEIDKNGDHSSGCSGRMECQTQDRWDTARKMESVMLWLKHWATRNTYPILDALNRRSINSETWQKVLDKCCKLQVEPLEKYLEEVLAEHPEYLLDDTERSVIEDCRPLRNQITVEINKIVEDMNKIRELYESSLERP